MIISTSQKLGVVSIPLIGTLALAFGLFGLAAWIEYDSVLLKAVLNIFVIFSVSLVVARVSTKSFLITGSSNVLLLGLAVFEFGFVATVGGFVSSINVTDGIAMYVIGALVSSSLHLASAILTYHGSPIRTRRLGLRIWFSYVATILFVFLLAFLTLNTPALTIVGQFGSLAQRIAVATIVALLLASAFYFFRVYSRSHSPILYWYSLALTTTSFAFIAFFTTQNNGDLATWTGIGGLCLASVYFLKSVLAAPKIVSGNNPGVTR